MDDASRSHRAPTVRELQIAAGIADGKELVEIAEELGISIRTVRTHLTSLRWKIQAKNTAHMVAILMRAERGVYPND